MKINPYIQVQQLYNTGKVSKTTKTSSTSRTDEVEISTIGRDIQTAKAALAQTPDVRNEVVAPLLTAVKNGNYEVSGSSFADKLLQAYQGQ